MASSDFDFQIETTAKKLRAPKNLADRSSEDQRDGYVEILPRTGHEIEHVHSLKVDKASQIRPTSRSTEAQTLGNVAVNGCYQCRLDEAMDAIDDINSGAQLAGPVLEARVDRVVAQLYDNTSWDVYAKDYAKLKKAATDLPDKPSAALTELASCFEPRLCHGRIIADLSWHPLWADFCAVALASAGATKRLPDLGRAAKVSFLKCKIIESNEDPFLEKNAFKGKKYVFENF